MNITFDHNDKDLIVRAMEAQNILVTDAGIKRMEAKIRNQMMSMFENDCDTAAQAYGYEIENPVMCPVDPQEAQMCEACQ